MAAKKEATVIIQMEIPLTQEQISYLSEMTDEGDTPIRRVKSVIMSLIEDQAGGGLMLDPGVVRKITDSTGVDPASGEDLIPFLAHGTGRIEGCRVATIKIDPAYEPALQEIATLRQMDIDAIVKETLEVCFDNEWYEHLPTRVRQVLMSEADHADLSGLLGKTFTTGTELAELVRKATGATGGLFTEPETEPAGATA